MHRVLSARVFQDSLCSASRNNSVRYAKSQSFQRSVQRKILLRSFRSITAQHTGSLPKEEAGEGGEGHPSMSRASWPQMSGSAQPAPQSVRHIALLPAVIVGHTRARITQSHSDKESVCESQSCMGRLIASSRILHRVKEACKRQASSMHGWAVARLVLGPKREAM